jgi:hypothetical protein
MVFPFRWFFGDGRGWSHDCQAGCNLLSRSKLWGTTGCESRLDVTADEPSIAVRASPDAQKKGILTYALDPEPAIFYTRAV